MPFELFPQQKRIQFLVSNSKILEAFLGKDYCAWPISGHTLIGANVNDLRFAVLKYFKVFYDVSTSQMTMTTARAVENLTFHEWQLGKSDDLLHTWKLRLEASTFVDVEIGARITIILVVMNSGRLSLKGSKYSIDAVEIFYLEHDGSEENTVLLDRLNDEPKFLGDLQDMELGRGSVFGVLTATSVLTIGQLFDMETMTIPYNGSSAIPASCLATHNHGSISTKRARSTYLEDESYLLLSNKVQNFLVVFQGRKRSPAGNYIYGELERSRRKDEDIAANLRTVLSSYRWGDMVDVFCVEFNFTFSLIEHCHKVSMFVDEFLHSCGDLIPRA